MIEQLDRSSGSTVGFAVSGVVGKADYDVLLPAMTALVGEHGSVNLLLDLTEFRWESADAWGADLDFGRDFKDHIARLAVVGDGAFAHLIAVLARPFYAQNVEYFTDRESAWSWAEQG